ncbi:2OG-Fe(II) oxygenase [Polyangium sp. 6x1]|uniref:2OG-Fe(II) oxygenase n=1 Tax=Polyangium sp. 6x1 TaxID=3042689 RepID=UPI0024824E8C|nr:2OG-Fe(II) oxygenase [Polyangium sp. 6x1]MDI1442439.1 2OG-Fe(II) oxygenase [Polyangium sp. 6x1]
MSERRVSRAGVIFGGGDLRPVMDPATEFGKALAAALDAVTEPLLVSGSWTLPAPVSLRIPGGPVVSVGRTEDEHRAFVDALLAHAEPAPFGDGAKTRVDPEVRNGLRLIARGQVEVGGFDPRDGGLLDAIERALSPGEQLAATLTDVLVYPPGGRFAAHRDTPREAEMVGTLVVGLPITHGGGAMIVRDGATEKKIAWGGVPDGSLRWVAFPGDVEHEIERVTSGYRVTLTYALSLRGGARARDVERVAKVREVLVRGLGDREILPAGGALVIPCARRVILPRRRSDAGGISEDTLRGVDRALAELLREMGLSFVVRPCLAFLDGKHAREHRPVVAWAAPMTYRLDRALTSKEIGSLPDVISLAADGERPIPDEDEGYETCTTITDRLLEERGEIWAWRERAWATLIHEADVSATGYFGNEHFDALVYEFAALEVRIGTLRERGIAVAEPARPRVRHTKFGEGDVIAEENDGDRKMIAVRFDDGTTRKLLAKFLTWITPAAVAPAAVAPAVAAPAAEGEMPSDVFERAIRTPPDREREARLVAAADSSFHDIDNCLHDCGLHVVAASIQPSRDAVEPLRATWAGADARVRYRFDPETSLRALLVEGPRSASLASQIVNVGRLPTVDSRLAGLLDSAKRAEVLRGLAAVAFLYGGRPGGYQRARLDRLLRHDDPVIRSAAERAAGPR